MGIRNFLTRLGSGMDLLQIRALSGLSSSLHTMFGRSAGITLEGEDTVTRPLEQVTGFAKIVFAITAQVAQVPFIVGQWKKETDPGTRRRFWKEGFGRTFQINRPSDAERRAAGQEVWIEENEHDLAKLFWSPNPHLSRYQLFEAATMWLLHEGETFFHFLGDGPKGELRNEGDIPRGLELLDPRILKSWPDNKLPEKWKYTTGAGSTKDIELFQIAQAKIFNPYDPVRGLSLRQCGGMAIHNLWDAWRFNRALMKNGGFPGGFIIGKNGSLDSKEDREQMKQWFEENHGGVTKSGRWSPVRGDVDIKMIELHLKQMQFHELIQECGKDLRGLYKVPEAEISEYENTSYASANVGRRSFWEATILPKLRLFEDALWLSLFSHIEDGRYEGRFDLTAIAALAENLTEKLAQAKGLRELGYTTNQINDRLKLDMPEAPMGDTAFRPIGMVPVDTPVNVPAAPPPAGDKKLLPAPVETKALTSDIDPELMNKEALAAYWNAWNEKVFRPGEDKFRAVMRKYFFELRKEQLKLFLEYDKHDKPDEKADRPIDASGLTVADIDKILFNREEWGEKLGKRVKPQYETIIGRAIKNRKDELGIDFTFGLKDPSVQEFMKRKVIKVKDINVTLRERLRKSLIKGIEEGESASDLAVRIRTLFNDTPSRALLIARTETLQATGWSQFETDVRSEIVIGKAWVDSLDNHVRDLHAGYGGMGYVPMDYEYDMGLKYPGDPNASAGQICNCRCTHIAQLEGETNEESFARVMKWTERKAA